MKKVNFIFLVFAIAIGAFAYHNLSSPQSKVIRVNVRDLPAHGLRLISPADPDYDREVEKLGLADQQIEAAKPFSVVLKNDSPRDVIAFRIRWDSVGTDGTKTSHLQSYSETGTLVGMTPLDRKDRSSVSEARVNSRMSRYVSLVPSDIRQQQGIGGYAGGGGRNTDIHEIQQSALDKNKAQLTNFLTAELASSESVTATLDAAVFADGTLVGPDSLNFFGQLQAIIKAKRDVLEEVLSAAQRKQPFDEIFAKLDAVAREQKSVGSPQSGQPDVYDLYKREFATELLRMRSADHDDGKVLWNATRPLYRQWPSLRKEMKQPQ